jgi:hypothetical protein
MPDELPVDCAHVWAVDQLGLAPACSAAAVERAFWTRLAQTEFAPHGSHIEAIDLLLQTADALARPDSTPQFRQHYERRLGEQIGAFAEQFFSLPPTDRKAKWWSLSTRASTCPPLHWRVERLKSGLAVDFRPLADAAAATNEVATWCGELFVLPPPARSTRKLEILTKLRAEAGNRLANAARQLAQLAPDIAALAPDLISEISNRDLAARRRARGRKTLARRQRGGETRGLVAFAGVSVVVIAVVFGGLMTRRRPVSGPQSQAQSDRQQLLLLAQSSQRTPLIIDAEFLLSTDQPLLKLSELSRQGPVKVRATAEQIVRLKQEMGEASFRICFGSDSGQGMGEIFEIDKAGDGGPGSQSPTARDPQQPDVISIDADDLLDPQHSPTQTLALLAVSQAARNRGGGDPLKQPRVQVRANAEQMRRLRERLTDAQFRVCFGNGLGDGMAELVETDKPNPPVPDKAGRSE